MNPYKSKCMSCSKRSVCGGTGVACNSGQMGCMGSCSSPKSMGSTYLASVAPSPRPIGVVSVLGLGVGVVGAAIGGYINGYVGARYFGQKARKKQVALTSAKGAALISGIIGSVVLVAGLALSSGIQQRELPT